ncbi:MAG: hypothetical protein GXO22_08090 [Aquificae bacterium]|nr:hypothetical protein [Aquificota bacterium]
MKILSCERKLDESLICIKGKKYRHKLYIKKTDTTISKRELIFSYTDLEFEIKTLYLPQIKDTKTKELLIKQKLSITDKDVVIKFLEDKESKQENKTLHYIYITKPDIRYHNIKILTLSQIAIHNITNQINTKEYIYHCFADNEKLILNISKDKILIYSRTIKIPNTEKKDPTNFFYENINLTYHYILQEKVPKIDLILVSGEIFSSIELSKLIYSFSNTPVATIHHRYIAHNIEEENFHEHLIPIGAVFTSDHYNFLPEKEKQKKAFNTVISYLNITLLILILLTGYFFIDKLSQIEQKLSILQNLNTKFIKEQNKILAKTNIKNITYYENYIKYLIKSQKTYLSTITNNLKELFYFLDIDILHIKKDIPHNSIIISIKTKKHFDTYSKMENFRKTLEQLLKNTSHRYKVINKSRYNYPNLEAVINIAIYQQI